MTGVQTAALVTTAVVVAVEGGILLGPARKGERGLFIVAFALALPMCWFAYFLVRVPLDHAVDRLLLGHYRVYSILKTAWAPLTEEPAKLWPLAIPWIFRRVSRQNAVKTAAALGMGFGVGEAWFVGVVLVGADPAASSLPWYALSGFMIERAMVCVMHGAFTSLVAVNLHRPWKWRLLGVAGAMGLHYLGNFPIFLAAEFPEVRGLLGLWLLASFVASLSLLLGLHRRGRKADTLDPRGAVP